MHVLGLPPAFVLSQDQTLKLKPPKGLLTFEPLHIVIDFDVSKFPQGNKDHIKLMKLTTPIIDPQAKTRVSKEPICKQSVNHMTNQTAHISLLHGYLVKERDKTTT